MVRCRVSSPQPKDRLLSSAIEYALGHGIVDLSLREIAAAIGTSHRMLIYHFGSREGLLVAVVREVELRQREVLADGEMTLDQARQFFGRLTDPALRAQERLFFEIYSNALLRRPGTEGFLDDIISAWTDPIVTSMTAAGVDPSSAEAFARLGLAVTRGLLLDLLATDDVAATTAAFQLYTELIERMWPSN